jgi:hypothetical protein
VFKIFVPYSPSYPLTLVTTPQTGPVLPSCSRQKSLMQVKKSQILERSLI